MEMPQANTSLHPLLSHTLATQRPRVGWIALNQAPQFLHFHMNLFTQISRKAAISHVSVSSQYLPFLRLHPRAICLTDNALPTPGLDPWFQRLWDATLDYVLRGGTVICMGSFSSSVRPEHLKAFFSMAGLLWEVGDFHRTTVYLNKEYVPEDLQPYLADVYSVKGMFLKGVDPAEAWYLPGEKSINEDIVWDKEPVNTENTPVARAKVGDGYVCFVGDCKIEPESRMAILAMCGLHEAGL